MSDHVTTGDVPHLADLLMIYDVIDRRRIDEILKELTQGDAGGGAWEYATGSKGKRLRKELWMVHRRREANAWWRSVVGDD